jgi:hypothetical protein
VVPWALGGQVVMVEHNEGPERRLGCTVDFITERVWGKLARSVWTRWGPWRGSGWSRRTMGRVRGF